MRAESRTRRQIMLPQTRLAVCAWCKVDFWLQRGCGRPKKYCASECQQKAATWRWHERRREAVRGVKAWWLGLTHEQRATAMAWVDEHPVPKAYLSRFEWAYLNREAFA